MVTKGWATQRFCDARTPQTTGGGWMSVRKGCELTPMTRLVSRLCSGVRPHANGVLPLPPARHFNSKSLLRKGPQYQPGSESGIYNSGEIEGLYVPLRQRRDLKTCGSWVRATSQGGKLVVILQRILQSKMPVPLQMRVNCVGLFCLGRPRLPRPRHLTRLAP